MKSDTEVCQVHVFYCPYFSGAGIPPFQNIQVRFGFLCYVYVLFSEVKGVTSLVSPFIVSSLL